MSLREILSNYWFVFQRELFPALEEEIGPLGERYELFVTVLEFVRVERFLASFQALPGRPQEDRAALARAFITFAESALPSRLHEALIEKTMQGHLVGHVPRDSTAIKGREKPTPKPPAKPKRGRGQPRRGEQRQGISGFLGRLQAAYRRSRWRRSA